MWPFTKNNDTETITVTKTVTRKVKRKRKHGQNPHVGMTPDKVRSGFFSTDVNRTLAGWDSHSKSIDSYLRTELTQLRARSRRLVRMNPYGKRFVETIKSNIVGPNGIKINAQTKAQDGTIDKETNDAIEHAFNDWANYHCDYHEKSSFIDLQNIAISSAAQDGELLFQIVKSGKYGLQLKAIDPELLDIQKNYLLGNGGQIRMGVEYNNQGKVVRYHFRTLTEWGDYRSGEEYSLLASEVIHGFIPQFADQSRGIPWMHSALEQAKHLEKYQEGAIVNARASANKFNVLKSKGDDQYSGDEETDDGVQIDNFEPGTTVDIGDREIQNIDPDYPHQMYDSFVKSNLRSIGSGFGISYHSLSNDLEGVNYSSIRAGVLEDRETFKAIQNWFIRNFVKKVYDTWVLCAFTSGNLPDVTLPPGADYMTHFRCAYYQPRRWAWVDPQKDMTANQLLINERLKSRSQIIREQGDDPDMVWAEIAKEEQLMRELGLQVIKPENTNQKPNENEEVQDGQD